MIGLHAQEVATLGVGTFVLVLKLVGKAVLFFNAIVGKASVEGPYRNHEADDEVSAHDEFGETGNDVARRGRTFGPLREDKAGGRDVERKPK